MTKSNFNLTNSLFLEATKWKVSQIHNHKIFQELGKRKTGFQNFYSNA